MTKKDFEALAAALRAAKPTVHKDTDRYQAWASAISAVADACQASNPRFDRDKFLRACDL